MHQSYSKHIYILKSAISNIFLFLLFFLWPTSWTWSKSNLWPVFMEWEDRTVQGSWLWMSFLSWFNLPRKLSSHLHIEFVGTDPTGDIEHNIHFWVMGISFSVVEKKCLLRRCKFLAECRLIECLLHLFISLLQIFQFIHNFLILLYTSRILVPSNELVSIILSFLSIHREMSYNFNIREWTAWCNNNSNQIQYIPQRFHHCLVYR